jgi:ribosomal protein S18 acetylase RimI-like enzyme
LYAAWRTLYRAYGESVGDVVNEPIAAAVWSWLMHGTHHLAGILAVEDDEAVVGFTHYRPFPRTLHANEACFLDDLYVAPSHRGRGIALELVRRVCEVAKAKGWTEVRWVTSADNIGAQRLYERIAARSDLLTYRLLLSKSVSS